MVVLERHGHELNGSMLAHWSESLRHGCMLLVFPNDSAHSFSWRGMDVNPAEASLLISQSHVCPCVCYVHFLWRVTVRCVWKCSRVGTMLLMQHADP